MNYGLLITLLALMGAVFATAIATWMALYLIVTRVFERRNSRR